MPPIGAARWIYTATTDTEARENLGVHARLRHSQFVTSHTNGREREWSRSDMAQ